jgi:raffinose/stachyose/melibiose transport system substrate-binding protein
MKNTLCTILSVALVASLLGGCSSNKNSGTASGSSATVKPAKEAKLSLMVTTRPNTGKKDFYLDYVPQLVKEKFPNITITVDQLPTDQYTSTIKMKMASGQGPDLFTWWANLQAKPLVDAGYVKDLSSLPMLGNFYKDILDAYTFDGKPYAVPLGMSFLTTWYNKDLFKKANISKTPENWTEFLDDCQKLKDAGITPITMGDKQSFVVQFGAYQMGASLIYADNKNFDKELLQGTKKFTDPKWVETIKRYQELYKRGYVVNGSLGLSQEQGRQLFVDGKAAMIFDGSFGYTQLTNKGAVDFERGIFPLPSNDAGKQMVYNLTPANGLFVNAKSQEASAVNDVVNYWFTKDTPLFKSWGENNDNISSYQGVTDSRALLSDYLKKYQPLPYIYNLNNAWPSGVSDVLCSKFQELIAGKGTPEDVTKGMQDKLDELNKK